MSSRVCKNEHGFAPQFSENIFYLFLVKWSLEFVSTQAGGDFCYHLNDFKNLIYNDD